MALGYLDRLPEEVEDRREGLEGALIEARFAMALDVFSRANAVIERRFALDTAVVFAAASITALLAFLLLGSAGLAKVFQKFPPKYNDALVGFVVAAVGFYVLLAG